MPWVQSSAGHGRAHFVLKRDAFKYAYAPGRTPAVCGRKLLLSDVTGDPRAQRGKCAKCVARLPYVEVLEALTR